MFSVLVLYNLGDVTHHYVTKDDVDGLSTG